MWAKRVNMKSIIEHNGDYNMNGSKTRIAHSPKHWAKKMHCNEQLLLKKFYFDHLKKYLCFDFNENYE